MNAEKASEANKRSTVSISATNKALPAANHIQIGILSPVLEGSLLPVLSCGYFLFEESADEYLPSKS
jgi:hypothetical protein